MNEKQSDYLTRKNLAEFYDKMKNIATRANTLLVQINNGKPINRKKLIQTISALNGWGCHE